MAGDYYSILGIDRNASQDEIKKAYRKLAHKYHPDKNGGTDEKFKEVNEAYQILSDSKKKSNYDNFGSAFGDGGFQGGFDFSDLFRGGRGSSGGFEDLFGAFSDMFGYRPGEPGSPEGGYRESPYQEEARGENLYLEILIGKKDLGNKKVVEYEAYDPCYECNGKGVAKGHSMINCKTCNGMGQIRRNIQTGFGLFSHVSICGACRGKKKIPEKNCSKCKASGRIKMKRKLEIYVPESIENGYNIVVPKGGNAGKEGAACGDLVISLKLR